jgi:hypothetical protein
MNNLKVYILIKNYFLLDVFNLLEFILLKERNVLCTYDKNYF